MTMETVECIVIVIGWLISVPILYHFYCEMRSYVDEIRALKEHLDLLQKQVDCVEELATMNKHHILHMLNDD